MIRRNRTRVGERPEAESDWPLQLRVKPRGSAGYDRSSRASLINVKRCMLSFSHEPTLNPRNLQVSWPTDGRGMAPKLESQTLPKNTLYGISNWAWPRNCPPVCTACGGRLPGVISGAVSKARVGQAIPTVRTLRRLVQCWTFPMSTRAAIAAAKS